MERNPRNGPLETSLGHISTVSRTYKSRTFPSWLRFWDLPRISNDVIILLPEWPGLMCFVMRNRPRRRRMMHQKWRISHTYRRYTFRLSVFNRWWNCSRNTWLTGSRKNRSTAYLMTTRPKPPTFSLRELSPPRQNELKRTSPFRRRELTNIFPLTGTRQEWWHFWEAHWRDF